MPGARQTFRRVLIYDNLVPHVEPIRAGTDMENADLYRLIGVRLCARRRLLEMTQNDVARRCGISFQHVHRHETGATAMTVERLLALAAALQVSVDHLLQDCSPQAFPEARSWPGVAAREAAPRRPDADTAVRRAPHA
jgi:transcriptional regulator with XRE-family HTH domain